MWHEAGQRPNERTSAANDVYYVAAMNDFDRWNRVAIEATARGGSTDEVLGLLREAGANPVHSMKVLCDTTGLGLGEAKKVVWRSPVWADQLRGHERLEDELVYAVEALERFRLAEAHFRLEPSEWTRPDVIDSAAELLSLGVDSPNLATLAGEEKADWREVERFLDLALKDVAQRPLNRSEAFSIVVDAAARDLVADRIDPPTAAKRIERATVANGYQFGGEARDLVVAALNLEEFGDEPYGPPPGELRRVAGAYLDRDRVSGATT
jgi:hypothetical protein